MATPLFLRRLLEPFLSQEPAHQLIRQTARQQSRLLALSLGSGLLQSFSEGATFGVVFLAVKVLSPSGEGQAHWVGPPLSVWMPGSAEWLNGLPPFGLFLGLLALALVLQAFQSFSRFVNMVTVGYFAARCKALVTGRIHRQVLALTFPCASGYKVGDLSDNINEGPDGIRIQIEQTSAVFLGLLLMATYLAVLVRISLWLLLVVLLMGALITLLQKQLLPRIRSGADLVSHLQVAVTSRITEDFQGLRLLHSSGQLDVAASVVEAGMGNLERQLRRQVTRTAVVGPITSFLPILAIVVIAALSLLLLGGRNTGVLPSLVTFVYALQKFNGQINILNTNLNMLAENTGRFNRLNGLLSPNSKQFRRVGGVPFRELRSAVRFESVGLRYSADLPPALSEVSFTLPKGQMLALVGASGAGKSSIADLLTGLYAPTEGCILIDDLPLEKIDLASWQQRLGVVSQDTFLFNATIAENIAFGTPWATPSQIQAASVAAQAASFIEELPQGFNTLVGERGYRLSGGQRQRLSLARAILRNPELLILDEATSALDSQSEKLVQEALERFERNHTVLVIAHRLSTIVRADKILVMEGGRIVQRGTHHGLLAEEGLYAEMWAIQNSRAILSIGKK
jgi:ATP-binding cassette subfamily B protein/subfamily B ATP-binding cassette protein MsbA